MCSYNCKLRGDKRFGIYESADCGGKDVSIVGPWNGRLHKNTVVEVLVQALGFGWRLHLLRFPELRFQESPTMGQWG